MSRAEYVWGAKMYLADFEKGETREYDEWRERFPWRSLAAIASRMGKVSGMRFRFRTRGGSRTITRLF
ncbi:MAG: hypothetical protein IKW20_02680 [Bacteroidales bacterium]|nr:hypothetical protein [Bacteroidales bacterium]